MKRVLEALQYFHSLSGLSVNNDKSQIFIAGMSDDDKAELADFSGFK